MKKENILQMLFDYSPFWKRLSFWINRVKYTSKINENIWSKLIKVLVWFRRSWKSYIFRYLIDYLISNKWVNKNNIMFLNLEDDRLYWYRKIETLREIYEVYLNWLKPVWKIYLFFDEIQLIQWWESFIRTIYEQNNDVEIFLTWSNSDLLSSEISSSLSWRFIEFNIFPLDFKEYLEFNWFILSTELDLIRYKKDINNLFDRYLQFGGLPEILELKNDEQIKWYLKSVFAKIVIDDIVKRFWIRNIELLELLNKYIITNIWWILSHKKIENALKKYSYKISSQTLSDYIDFIKRWFIIYDVSKFDWRIKHIFNNFKKYYVLDLWIREVEKINFDNDLSKKIENLVFMKLFMQNNKIYYWQDENQKEIDFIVLNNKKFDKYQVITNLTSENEARELWNFVLWSKYIDWTNFLITIDKDTEILNYKSIKIKKINIINFLLDFY
jgi:hypothetical protein